MKNFGPRWVMILCLAVFVFLGLGRFFDSRCEKGCVQDAIKSSPNWQDGHFNLHFGSEDDTDSKEELAGNDAAPVLPPLDDVETIIVKSTSTEWNFKASEGETELTVEDSRINRWVILKDGNTLTIEVKSGGAKAARLKLSKAFKGVLEIHSVSGELEIGTNLAVKDLTIESTSGDVTLSCWPSESLRVKTVSGDIRNRETGAAIIPKFIDLTSVSGDMQFEISKSFEDLRIKTISGDVTVKVPDESAFNLDLYTISGSYQGLPTRDANQDWGHSRYSGKIGNPDRATLHFESVSGDFALAKRSAVSNR